MVKLTVYGNPQATCTQRVLILLEELELKYKFENIDFNNQEQKSPDYLKLQPFGKVPVVQYGDKAIFESRAILRYIAKNNREEEFDYFGDVFTDMWLEVESQNFNPHASEIVYQKKWAEESNQQKIDEAIAKLEPVLDIYNSRLEDKNYISGNSFTIADISHIPYAYQLLKCGYKDLVKSRPNVYSWLKRIIKRPAVKRVLEGKYFQDDQSE